MPFEYGSNVSAVITLLQTHNTTTATPDLSANLHTRIDDGDITADDPEMVNVRYDRVPAVFVRISAKDEDFAGIGQTGVTSARVKKKATVVYDIIGIVAKESGHDSHANVLTEVYELARNIEATIYHEFSLNSTALWAQPFSTEFFGPFQVQGSWMKTVLVKVQAEYLFR